MLSKMKQGKKDLDEEESEIDLEENNHTVDCTSSSRKLKPQRQTHPSPRSQPCKRMGNITLSSN